MVDSNVILKRVGRIRKCVAALEMTGMRNVLVHEYLEVDHSRLYAIMKNNLGDFEKLIKAVLKLM